MALVAIRREMPIKQGTYILKNNNNKNDKIHVFVALSDQPKSHGSFFF